jgi:hypothetical protein
LSQLIAGAELGQGGAFVATKLALVLGLKRPATMRTRLRYRYSVPGKPSASGGIE